MGRLIVTLVGEAGAGKTEVRRHLAKQYDFSTILISDIIRDYARLRGIPLLQRPDFLTAHRQMKAELGVGHVADTVLATPGGRLAVDGLRVPNDLERIRANAEVICRVIAFPCPAPIRFERAKGRTLDPPTYEEFLENDAADAYNPDLEYQNTLIMMEMADHAIDASQSKEVVLAEVDDYVVPLLG